MAEVGSARSIRGEVAAFKRERILEVAADLFYERGYENTTLDAVADHLGVRKPFIYTYYKSKSELLAEICQRGIEASLAAMDEALSPVADCTTRMRRLGTAFTLAVLRSQKHIAIFAREEKNLLPEDFSRINAMRREFDRRLKLLLEEGRKSGEFSFSDKELAALAIGGMVSWAYVWYREDGRLDAETLATEMAELILSMVQAKVEAPGAAVGPESVSRSRKVSRRKKAR